LPVRQWNFPAHGPSIPNTAGNSTPSHAIEHRPATCAALEKYLGSGLIKGVGPKTAKKIVRHFDKETLGIFEGDIERLTEVPGIAEKKLKMISAAWAEHRAIRDVMMFLAVSRDQHPFCRSDLQGIW
jgi:ATP-dependent exoDNAse (exonuclease V) alpha subunit